MASSVEARCPTCQTVISGSYKFCPDCGVPSPKSCGACGTPNSRDAKFCTECGSHFSAETSAKPSRDRDISPSSTPKSSDSDPADATGPAISLAPEGERRQLTVLLADVSGYTAMNEKFDPESVNELLDRIKKLSADVVKRHGGIVNQFIGDEVVALFGIGNSENAGQAAVQAALDIRNSVRQFDKELSGPLAGNISMHFGVCSGLLVIRPSDNREGIFSLTGDPINTASRLLDAAQADEIIIGPETQRSVHSYFVLEPVGPLPLKGKAQALLPFRVLDAQPFQSSFQARVAQGLAHFTGRSVELAQLFQLIERAREGEGQAVVISGQAGLGKSRLVHEFLGRLNSDDITAYVGRCAPSTLDTPYHAWIELLRAILHLDGSDDAKTLIEKAKAHGSLARHLPTLLSLLALTSPEYSLPSNIAQQARPQMIWDAIYSVMRYASAHQPKILWLEDWHWADKASDQCLRDLFRHLPSIPILVVLTLRPGTGIAWPVMDNLTALSLRPLDRKATWAIVSAMFSGAAAPEAFVNLMFERTNGNPLFIEEVVRYLREDGSLVEREGNVTLTQPLVSLIIPDSVQSAVLRRLDRINPAWREILRRAAVIGREFPLAVLEKLAAPGTDLQGALTALLGMDLITELQDDSETRYGFKHVITQEVTYDTLLHKQRRELHGATARAIEEIYSARSEEYYDQLAFHYSRSDLTEKALEFLEKAGDRASAAFALDAARNQFDAAIQILERPDFKDARTRRIAMSIKWSTASVFAAAERQIEVMSRALADAEQIQDTRLIAKCRYWLGRMHYGGGNPTKAIENFEMSLALAKELCDEDLIARCYCVVGRISLFTSQVSHGLEYLTKGVAAMRKLRNSAEISYSLSNMGCIHAFTGNFADAEQAFEEALQLARQQNNRSDEALVAQGTSYARCLRGDWVGLGEAADRCIEISTKSGLPVLLAFGRVFRAYARALSGEMGHGYRQMLEAIAAHESTGSKLAASLCHGWCAEVCSLQGDLVSAKRHADISIERGAVGDCFGQLPALRALAHVAAREGQSAEARTLFNRALEVANAWGALPDSGITYLRLAELDETSPFADEMREKAALIFKECQMPWWQARANN